MARWPEETERVERLRSRGVPRLLLLDSDLEPPTSTDCLEDWIRVPAAEADISARTAALRHRVERHGTLPTLDGDGILRFRDRWVGLSPVERSLAGALTWPSARGRAVSRRATRSTCTCSGSADASNPSASKCGPCARVATSCNPREASSVSYAGRMLTTTTESSRRGPWYVTVSPGAAPTSA